LTYSPALSIMSNGTMTTKTEKPTFSKSDRVSIAMRLGELSNIEDIDDMLQEGVSSRDVARFIQDILECLTDVTVEALTKVITERRKKVVEPVNGEVILDDRLAAIVPSKGRRPGTIAKSVYGKQRKTMDRMIELECLYLAQRDRIDLIIGKENELGVPFDITDRNILSAARLVEMHGKEEREAIKALGGAGQGEGKIDVGEYSEKTAEVLKKPDARRRVVSIVERIKRRAEKAELEAPQKAAGDE